MLTMAACGANRFSAVPPALISVLQYCDRGSLADAIRAKRFWSRQAGRPHLRAALLCLRDVACGMAHLHSHSVVHGGGSGGICLVV